MSTQFSKDVDHRERYIRSLQELLQHPSIITTEALMSDFPNLPRLRILTTTDIDNISTLNESCTTNLDLAKHSLPGFSKQPEDLAVLLLTSGSTGEAKAVSLTHLQILSFIIGKIKIHGTTPQDTFLAWTGLSDHHVSYTFASNFLLAKICFALDSLSSGELLSIDLSHLRALISGGESNTIETAAKLTALLQRYNAPKSFIRPGLGLTETCAGAVYSLDCPAYDISQDLDHCSVGKPTNAIKIRFKTGDLALIDKNGNLLLIGRDKDFIIINGSNYYSQVTSSYTVAFPHRPKGHDTEVFCIVYLPSYDSGDYAARSATEIAISKRINVTCGVRPYEIIPLAASCLQKSSLGKLSRQSIRDKYEKGSYATNAFAKVKLRQIQRALHQEAATSTERTIIDTCLRSFPNSSVPIGRDSDLFALGLSSIDLLHLQSSLQIALKITNIPHTTLFSHLVIHELAAALDSFKQNYAFSPVVVLQAHGDKTPIWLIHSGLGEILIFMNLARYLNDRPVYAVRARGFDGEPHFTSLDELITTYHSAIKRKQPEGPYAIAGYAFGGILAVVLLLASFVGLIKEDYAISYLLEARQNSHEKVLDHIMSTAPQSRLQQLGMNKESINNWACIALFMKRSLWDYDPKGMVKCMDVFYTVPVAGYGPATNVEDCFTGYISKWDAFVKGGAKYHLVEGSHKTMISPPNVNGFQKFFKRGLKERGL
ncbi:hypothetical protein IFR05_015331 [Cadophora sp. M221]|nr:hypothetical protein IFR05_015331 [Cadophora sp. M221]